MKQSKFPDGWDDDRVRKVLAFYGDQSEEESATEDEVADDSQVDEKGLAADKRG